MGAEDSSSDASSSTQRKRHRKKDNKKGRHVDKKSKKVKKKSSRKECTKHKDTEKSKKRKLTSSSDSSSPSSKPRRMKKMKKEANDKEAEVQQTWILARDEAIRNAEPDIPEEQSLARAVEEYCLLFGAQDSSDQTTANSASCRNQSDERIEDESVASTVAAAVRDATEKSKAAGCTEVEVEAEARRAKESVLEVLAKAGLYTRRETPQEKELPMFVQEKEKKLKEYVRLGVPMTDDRSRALGPTSTASQKAAYIENLKLL